MREKIMVTTDALAELGACDAGMKWWARYFPSGVAEFEVIVTALANHGQYEYLEWLKDAYGCLTYKFEELSEGAREYAIGTLTDDPDYSFLYEDLVRAGEMIGVEFNTRKGTRSEPCIWWTGFYSQGSGLGFDGTYRYAKGAPKAVAEEYPQDYELLGIATALQEAQRPNFYRLYAMVTSVRDTSISVSVEDGENPYRAIGDAERLIEEALQDFCSWMYQRVQDQYEWETSEDAVKEQCEANEYRFDVRGRLI